MWCLCKETETNYFIVNLSTGAKIYIDDSGVDELSPSYRIVFENETERINLKYLGNIDKIDSDIQTMFRAIMMDIFNSLKKGECIDLSEDL